jgi:hypothetical protein
MPYNFDPTGSLPANLVVDELHTLTEVNTVAYRIIIPEFAPFYTNNLAVVYNDGINGDVTLTEGTDYVLCLPYLAASRSIGAMVYGGISFNFTAPNGTIKVTYQTIGGSWIADPNYVYEKLIDIAYNPRVTVWDVLTNVQQIFPPINHDQSVDYVYDSGDIILKMQEIADAILNRPQHIFNVGVGFDPDRIIISDGTGSITTGNLTVSDINLLISALTSYDARLTALETNGDVAALQTQVNNLVTSLNDIINRTTVLETSVATIAPAVASQANRIAVLESAVDYLTDVVNMLVAKS